MEVDRVRRVAATLEHPECDVRRDPVEPRDQGRVRLVRAQSAPRVDERLLQRVVGVVEGAEQPVAVKMQRSLVR